MRLLSSGAIALIMLAGCGTGSPAGPTADSVDLKLEWMGFGDEGYVARVTVKNIGTEAVAYRCGSLFLETESASGWQLSKSPSCPATSPWIPLAPGESYSHSFDVGGGHRYRAAAGIASPDGSHFTVLYSEGSEPAT